MLGIFFPFTILFITPPSTFYFANSIFLGVLISSVFETLPVFYNW